MRRANNTRFVLLKFLGVDGSICSPGPAVFPDVPPVPMIELTPLRPLIEILVLGDAD